MSETLEPYALPPLEQRWDTAARALERWHARNGRPNMRVSLITDEEAERLIREGKATRAAKP